MHPNNEVLIHNDVVQYDSTTTTTNPTVTVATSLHAKEMEPANWNSAREVIVDKDVSLEVSKICTEEESELIICQERMSDISSKTTENIQEIIEKTPTKNNEMETIGQ